LLFAAFQPPSLNLALASTDVGSVTITWTPVTAQTVAHYEVSKSYLSKKQNKFCQYFLDELSFSKLFKELHFTYAILNYSYIVC